MLPAADTDTATGSAPARPATPDAISLILAQAGRSAEEIAALATLDDADRSAEGQFSGEPPTLTSLFGKARATEFDAGRFSPSPTVAATMAAVLEFLIERKRAGTLLDNRLMLLHAGTIAGLARLGFFGLAIPEAYGGHGARLGDLGPLLRALTLVHPDLAVMFEVHNFLGPVTPLLDFGTEQQKRHFLPRMARGELLGSFALTEPGVGADPSRLSLSARRDGDQWLVSGVKWPITNVVYGGICILVLKLEGENLPQGRDSAMLVFEVPQADDARFRMVRNRLNAFDYLWNARFRMTDCPVPIGNLLGPPGKGLAQAFSSLAKGRGGICVNSAVKIFRLLAQLIQDPEAAAETVPATGGPRGWIGFRHTFGKPIGEAPRIRTWVGRATAEALAARCLGDVCFRLAANGIRDETMGMIAKVYSTRALLQTAIHAYQIQGGRSVHVDERRLAARDGHPLPADAYAIENYIGENIHEFAIATVYEGPNPVLADVGAPNAMTRGIRAKYLEPIGLAEAKGHFGWAPKLGFAWYVAANVLGSLHPWPGSVEGIRNPLPWRQRLIRRAFRRNRILGRRILLVIARYQKSFIDESFLLGDEGGVFDCLCASVASLVYAIATDRSEPEYQLVGESLDLEAQLLLAHRSVTPHLQRRFADIGRAVMTPGNVLHRDLVADIHASPIPLDPRSIDRFI
ncbi:MAG: acyl-CoA dehydrogenase [Planctomycetota bacterium]|nr:MAG: acyl-CoA dehydrogenase [Planctomycetota bacterium]